MFPRLYRLCVLCLMFLPALAWAAPQSISGELLVRYIDYPNGAHQKEYLLRTAGGEQIPIDTAEIKDFELGLLKTGSMVTFTGELRAGGLVAEGVEIESLSGIGTQSVTGSRSIAVLIVNLNDAAVTCNASQLDSLMFTASNSMREQFELSSRNQLTFERDHNANGQPDIFGPYTINHSASVCNPNGWETSARAAAQAAGVNLSAYQHVMLVMPRYDLLACGWSGLGNVGCPSGCTTWIANCTHQNTFAHELGHNLGMDHSSTLSDDNQLSEYSDWSCPMGNGHEKVYFNAPQQIGMGWLDAFPGRVQNVSTAGTFTVSQLEGDSGSVTNPQVLRIQKNATEYYYISYRKRDPVLNGLNAVYDSHLSVHLFAPGAFDARSKLRDLLADGQSFEDSALNLTVSLVSHTATTAQVLVSFGSSADSDNDGVTTYQETVDGTDGNDPGSFLNHLTSPVYLLWNGFLGMTNIVELVNSGSSTANVTLSLYSISGARMHQGTYTVPAFQQFDVILNGLPGFTADSYGLVKLEYSGAVDGRVSYYRAGEGAGFEFAYSIPFTQPLKGETNAGFNTFQPSTNPADAANPVYNWLTIVNLATSSKSYTIESYSQVGALITSRNVSVPAAGRLDIDGGHGFIGPNVVGLHKVRPTDASAPYIAQLIRYGVEGSGFSFAFPLGFRAGNGRPVAVPISRQESGSERAQTTWVEVLNTKNASVPVTVQLRKANGAVTSYTRTLAPHSQEHFEASSTVLDDGSVGYALVTPSGSNSLIVQAMVYSREVANGSIGTMYGVPAREVLGAVFDGSYNTYLNQYNWLSISNTTSSPISVIVSHPYGVGGEYAVTETIAANSTLVEPIHDTYQIGVIPDSYGLLRVTTTSGGQVITDLLREHPIAFGVSDFAFPTSIRTQ